MSTLRKALDGATRVVVETDHVYPHTGQIVPVDVERVVFTPDEVLAALSDPGQGEGLRDALQAWLDAPADDDETTERLAEAAKEWLAASAPPPPTLDEARVARVLFDAANLEVVTGDPEQVDDDLVRKWSRAVAKRVRVILAASVPPTLPDRETLDRWIDEANDGNTPTSLLVRRVLQRFAASVPPPPTLDVERLAEAIFRAGIGLRRDGPAALPWAKENQQAWARWIGQAQVAIAAEYARLAASAPPPPMDECCTAYGERGEACPHGWVVEVANPPQFAHLTPEAES